MDRHAKFLWMKEVLDHINECHAQWQSAQGQSERYLAETMRRDLDEIRRICELIRRDCGQRAPMSVAC
jgi:hypothetical protein